MPIKKAAIVPGTGIGDALNFMLAAHQFYLQGYEVTMYSHWMSSFGSWFSSFIFKNKPPLSTIEKEFSQYDAIIVHFDNTQRCHLIKSLRTKGIVPHVFLFYNNYRASKHGDLNHTFDFAFDESISVTHNIAWSLQKIFSLPSPCYNIGMQIPTHLTHRKNKQQILIHPTSSWSYKNWTPKKYITLAQALISKGYQPMLTVSATERQDWIHAIDLGIAVPHIPNLAHLSQLYYESGYFIGNDSGPGHLASYLKIPLIIIAAKPSIYHWQPGWLSPHIILPPRWVPNIKRFRLREHHWQWFVTTQRVLKIFKNIAE